MGLRSHLVLPTRIERATNGLGIPVSQTEPIQQELTEGKAMIPIVMDQGGSDCSGSSVVANFRTGPQLGKRAAHRQELSDLP